MQQSFPHFFSFSQDLSLFHVLVSHLFSSLFKISHPEIKMAKDRTLLQTLGFVRVNKMWYERYVNSCYHNDS